MPYLQEQEDNELENVLPGEEVFADTEYIAEHFTISTINKV